MITVYRASAGSGKTFRLTGEYIRLLFKNNQTQHPHRNILAVTFTNKATDEMKSRIVLELHRLANHQASPYLDELKEAYGYTEEQIRANATKILNGILHDYSSFSISTIDKFFQQVIRAFAREIGVQGGYALELDKDRILDQAVDNLFLELSSAENKQLLEWLTQFAEERIEKAENWNMRKNILDLGQEIFKEHYQNKAEEVHDKLHDRVFLKQFREELNSIIRRFNTDLENIRQEALTMIRNEDLQLEDFKGASRSGMKGLESIIKKYELKNTFRDMAEDVGACYTQKTPQSVIEKINRVYNGGLQERMLALIDRLDTGLIHYNSATLIKKHINSLGILSDLAVQIQKLTNDQNIMLISDSNLLLHKIIDNSDTPFIYEKTGLRIDHFMIDEFQDTSDMQWKNFLPLIQNSLSAGNNNLVVGDVKQSIYRWRNSDWKLLESQIYEDFDPLQLCNETLGTNYRSDKHIVAFNNSFFTQASAILQQKLNDALVPVLDEMPGLHPLTNTILNAYLQTKQETKANADDGYVNISFIDDSDSEDKWKEIALERLPAMVEDCQRRGYRACDIAFLVRTKNEAQLVIEKLLNYKTTAEADPGISYDIIGNEGLLIESASAVRFLVGILHLLIHPDDLVQQTIVSYEYGRGRLNLTDNEALAATFTNKEVHVESYAHQYDSSKNNKTEHTILLCCHFTEQENVEVQQLKHLPLFEICEQLIHRFELANWHGEAVFLQAFQDIIFSYSTGKSPDLNSFLQWWKKNSHRKAIEMPDNENAMRVMTIHKSKGLDFKVVMIPFCDWSIDNRMRPVLWCETQTEPYSKLPLLPVEYGAKLGKSIFAEQYYQEMMRTFIDNLNIAYVAFTRARNEMYCICKLPKKASKTNEISTDRLSSILYKTLYSTEPTNAIGNYDEDTNCWTHGLPQRITFSRVDRESEQNGDKPINDTSKSTGTIPEPMEPENINTNTGNPNDTNTYPVALLQNRLRIRHRINNFSREETDITENPLDYGTLMHELLSELTDPADYQHLVDKLIKQGRINHAESLVITTDLEAFKSIPEVAEWFDPSAVILSESTIVTPEGQLYRPDRVMINDTHATVVDYKFGQSEQAQHIRQVEHYGKLLKEMGYSCTGYLCYVKLKKIVKVL